MTKETKTLSAISRLILNDPSGTVTVTPPGTVTMETTLTTRPKKQMKDERDQLQEGFFWGWMKVLITQNLSKLALLAVGEEKGCMTEDDTAVKGKERRKRGKLRGKVGGTMTGRRRLDMKGGEI